MPNPPQTRAVMDRNEFAARLSWTPERFAAALAAGKLPPPDFIKAKMPLWKPQTVANAVSRHRG